MKTLFLTLTALLLLTACDEDMAERVAKCSDATEAWLQDACDITGGVMPPTCADTVGLRPIESVDIEIYAPREDGAPYCLLLDKLCTYTYIPDDMGDFENIMYITCDEGV